MAVVKSDLKRIREEAGIATLTEVVQARRSRSLPFCGRRLSPDLLSYFERKGVPLDKQDYDAIRQTIDAIAADRAEQSAA